jgi:hypothetical protein
MQDSNPVLNSIKPMTPTPMPNEFNTISYRLDSVEKQLLQLQGQLSLYVPQRENELQLNRIQDSVRDIKDDVTEIRKQMQEISQKLIAQESEAQRRDAAQRERQDKMQIRALWAIVSVVLTVIGGCLIYFITNR